jgi:PAS domain S-box-containing protein
MEVRLATAAPSFAFDDDLTIVAWSEGAEELTGIAAEDAVGQPCWAVLGGRDDDGGLVCHQQCTHARLAREGRTRRALELDVRTGEGRRRVVLDTISAVADGRGFFVHLLREASEVPPPPPSRMPRLTPRQRDVLRLLAEGLPARRIAAKLWLSEATVRNHIRGVLVELESHSQLEAVSRARKLGLV